jgi:hypothetical protein
MFFLIPIAFAVVTGALIETRWQFPRDVQISSPTLPSGRARSPADAGSTSRSYPAYSRVMHPDWPPPPSVPAPNSRTR